MMDGIGRDKPLSIRCSLCNALGSTQTSDEQELIPTLSLRRKALWLCFYLLLTSSNEAFESF